jgi:hypothetical protein
MSIDSQVLEQLRFFIKEVAFPKFLSSTTNLIFRMKFWLTSHTIMSKSRHGFFRIFISLFLRKCQCSYKITFFKRM